MAIGFWLLVSNKLIFIWAAISALHSRFFANQWLRFLSHWFTKRAPFRSGCEIRRFKI